MADGSADFVLRLTNKISAPARRAQRSVMSLSDALRSQQKINAQGESSFQRNLRERRRMMDSTNSRQMRAMSVERKLARQRDVTFQRGLVRQRMAVRSARRQAEILEGIRKPSGASAGGGGLGAGFMGGLAASGALMIGNAITGLAGRVVDLGKAFAGAAFHAIDFGQRTQLALTALIGDSAVAAAQFSEVRREAQKLGLDVFDTVDSFRKLLTAQFDIKTAREITQRTADLRALGSSAEEVKFAVLAISQIKMKGKLQAEELTRQLANAGVSTELVYQELEKQMGKTREEVLRMQQAGEIKADPAVRAILDAIGRKTGGQAAGALAEQMATQKVGGIIARWRALGQNMMISLGEGLAPAATQVMKKLDAFFQRFVKSGGADRLGNAIVSGVQRFADWVDMNWPKIEALFVGGFERFVEFVETAGDRIVQIKNILAGFGALFAAPLFHVTMMRKIFGFILDIVVKVVEWIGKMVTRFSEFVASPALTNFAKVLSALGFTETAGSVLTLASDAANAAEQGNAAERQVNRRKAERAAESAMAQRAGQSLGGNKFGDIKFGDLIVNGVDANKAGDVGAALTTDIRGRMITILEDS